MFNMKRLLSLLFALVMALAIAQPAVGETTETELILGTFNGAPVYESEVAEYLETLYQNEFTDSDTDYAYAAQYYMQNKVLETKSRELGFYEFTDEERQALYSDADAEWEAALAQYVTYFLSEDTDEARAKARADGEAYYLANYGYTGEVIRSLYLDAAARDRLNEYLLGDYAPSEDDIKAVFEEYGAYHQMLYGDAPTYEYETYYNGSSFWSRPEGYRSVIHILLIPDAELLSAYVNAQSAYEEALSASADETAEASAPADLDALKAAVDNAAAAVIASKQTVIDDINTRIANGESFQALIMEYGEDPGMENEATLAEGYPVHKDSIIWEPAFTTGAFAENMTAPGAVSAPVLSSRGIHIIFYLADIPGGLIDMTDDIRSAITEYLISLKGNEVYNEALENWLPDYEIVYDNDAIALATQKAQESANEATDTPDTETPAITE